MLLACHSLDKVDAFETTISKYVPTKTYPSLVQHQNETFPRIFKAVKTKFQTPFSETTATPDMGAIPDDATEPDTTMVDRALQGVYEVHASQPTVEGRGTPTTQFQSPNGQGYDAFDPYFATTALPTMRSKSSNDLGYDDTDLYFATTAPLTSQSQFNNGAEHDTPDVYHDFATTAPLTMQFPFLNGTTYNAWDTYFATLPPDQSCVHPCPYNNFQHWPQQSSNSGGEYQN
jgi:hypothetical protein